MNNDFMKALWELATSLIQKAKDKGFDILLLLGVVGGLIWYILHTESDWVKDKAEMRGQISSLGSELKECNASRSRLEVKVAVLDVELQAFKKVFNSRHGQR